MLTRIIHAIKTDLSRRLVNVGLIPPLAQSGGGGAVCISLSSKVFFVLSLLHPGNCHIHMLRGPSEGGCLVTLTPGNTAFWDVSRSPAAV